MKTNFTEIEQGNTNAIENAKESVKVIRTMTQKLQKEVEETSERMIEFELEREQMMQENMKVHLTAIKQNSLSLKKNKTYHVRLKRPKINYFL